ncbi:hypothetical protein B7494_g7378 [Chlorociboria aeruginascens]|nr:hypothetical protein B7494_g7378 [Chlorociboria aeruginascens]
MVNHPISYQAHITNRSQNSQFNTALKQSTSLKRDLTSPPPTGINPSFLGQISSSLTSFSRTLDTYSTLAASELNPTKKEKACERIKSFREELASYRSQFSSLKASSEEAQISIDRGELLGRRPHNTSTPDNPYANATVAAEPWRRDGGLSMQSGDHTRESHALREQTFFQNTHTALDEYLARGQAVLGDLGQQRDILKGTQKRLYSVANTLGVSGDTIRMIERRAKQDKWIFWAGVGDLIDYSVESGV